MKPWIIGNLLLITWLTYSEAQKVTINEDETPITSRFHCMKNGCCDHHEWCRFWASVGECKTNSEWMLDNCQLACNSCRPAAHRQPTAATQPRTTPRPAATVRRLTTKRPTFFTTSPRTRPATRGRRPVPTATPLRARPLQENRATLPPRTLRPTVTSVNNSTIRLVMLRRNRGRGGVSHHRLPNHLRVPSRPIPTVEELSQKFHLKGLVPTAVRTTHIPHFVTSVTDSTASPRTTFRFISETHRVFTVAPTTTTTTTTTPRPTTTTTPTTTTSTTTTERPTTERTTTTTTHRPTTTTTRRPTTTTTRRTTTRRPTTTTTTTTTTTPPPTTTTSTTTTTTTPEPTTTTTASTTTTTTTPPPTTTSTTTTSTTTTPTTTTSTTTTTTTPAPTTTTELPTTTDDEDQRLRTRPTTRTLFRQSTTTTTTTTTAAPTTVPPRRQMTSRDRRCREILDDNIVAAEEMIRERLVVSTEDNSRRRTVDLDGVIRSNLANACVPRMDESDCESNLCYNAYFRTMDGTCNNLNNPLRGASYRPYTRLLPTVYDNELSEPIASLFPDLRPSPREITRQLTSSQASVEADDYNAMVMQFGQFLSHDMAKTTLVPSSKCNVCQNVTSRCMAVPVGSDDPNLGFRKSTCVRVSRSSPICGSGRTKPRQQLNENTGYIDVSPIYGSSVHDSLKFRDGTSGFLKLPSFRGLQALPFDQSKCRSRQSCTVIFTAGDSRVNLFVGLSAWHTIFTKEHNRIVTELKRLNPHWDGERLYQEARKIVGAQMQAIVYREWLPKVLGAAFATVVGDYHGYDQNVDSTIANEFTSAAFRFGHGMIQEMYQRLDPNFSNSTFGPLAFQKGTLHSDVLLNEGGPDPLLRGMFSQHVKRPQRVTTTVTENMFGSTDLSSINIQRGRDHGHPSYTKYRELCGMGVATDFEHFSREILHPGTRDKLRKVYGNVDKVDLWVGALMEDPVIRGLVGPTIACIIGPQFKRTREGDRFYYERPGVFTRHQLSEIRKSSLSRIICDNSQTITMVPREAFRIGHLTPCSQIPSMDLSKWREF